jgi:hypothetical protein
MKTKVKQTRRRQRGTKQVSDAAVFVVWFPSDIPKCFAAEAAVEQVNVVTEDPAKRRVLDPLLHEVFHDQTDIGKEFESYVDSQKHRANDLWAIALAIPGDRLDPKDLAERIRLKTDLVTSVRNNLATTSAESPAQGIFPVSVMTIEDEAGSSLQSLLANFRNSLGRGTGNDITNRSTRGRGTRIVELSQLRDSQIHGREVSDADLATVPLNRVMSAVDARLREGLGGIDFDPLKAQSSLPAAIEFAEHSLRELQAPIRKLVRRLIDNINNLPEEKRTMGSLDANREFAKKLQRILSTVGDRLCCPTCRTPGTLRCAAGRSPQGVFAFAHSTDGKTTTHGGWSRLPELTLMK